MITIQTNNFNTKIEGTQTSILHNENSILVSDGSIFETLSSPEKKLLFQNWTRRLRTNDVNKK